MSKDLSKVSTWQNNFGLLPIHLSPDNPEDESFIMLNGGHGDFCLKTKNEDDHYDFNSSAWSSNTKNFIAVNNNSVKVYNWKKEKPEELSSDRVANNFNKFYNYLLSTSYKSESDVVPFIIDIFKQFRNFTQERNNPVAALNLLFLLLASIDEDINNLNFEKWGIQGVATPINFEFYAERLKSGSKNVRPQLDLIIRHTSGILFQEAQKEVSYFDRQIDLWGGYSNKIEAKGSLYSSIHYTPPYLARTIVERALQVLDLTKPNQKILDPACGSGEFLIESLKQLREKNYQGTIQIVGWDTSFTAVNTTTFLLSYEKRTIWDNKLDFQIRAVDDSLTEVWDNDFDLILMNPPFVSWEQMDKKSRDSVKGTLPSSSIGKPNQASAFFYKTIHSLNQNGVVGCVMPSSLLTLHSYKALRNEIYGLIDITLIGKLGNFVFEDALTDVSMIVGHKPKNDGIPLVLWTKNEKGVIQDALRDLRKMHYLQEFKAVEKDYSIYTPTVFPITRENWKTISFQESELLKKIERFVLELKLVRVMDVFNVKQGIRLGNNAFKITKEDFLKLPQNEKSYFRPAIDNESVKNGQLSEKNFIWYPYDVNGLIINSEEQLIASVPTYYSTILASNKELLKERARKDLTNWWSLSEHRAWLRAIEPRLVSTEFGRSDSFAFDKLGNFVAERGNGWIPKKDFVFIDDYYFYLAIFSSQFFDRLLSIYSKQLAGGNWFDLGKKYTDDIPIPDINDPEVKTSAGYLKLVQVGMELSIGNLHVKPIADEFTIKYFYPEV